jgi:hypothetical protein
MERKMKKLIILLIALSLTSCAMPKFYWPEYRESVRIAIEHPNCDVASQFFCDYLISKGYDARVTCGSTLMETDSAIIQPALLNKADTQRIGEPMPNMIRRGHCVVEVRNPDTGKWHWIDVTRDTGGFESKYYEECKWW